MPVDEQVQIGGSAQIVQLIFLDTESAEELRCLMEHFLLLEHWKILPFERALAATLRDKMGKDEGLSQEECNSALCLLKKVFDIADEIPRDQFRWRDEEFLQLELVLESFVENQ